jgi:hypothetical protein
MRAALTFGGRDDLHLFQPFAITLLSRRNVPAHVIDEALKKARYGDVITGSWVKERLAALALPPTRQDAGKPRSRAEVRSGTAPTIQAMRFTLDQWKASLPETIPRLSADELLDLENLILDLMLQLRSAKAAAAEIPVERSAARPTAKSSARRPRRELAVA